MPIYSPWIQDDDFEADGLGFGPVDRVINNTSVGAYTDPGTPFAPAIDTTLIDSVIADAEGETSWTTAFSNPFSAFTNQTGGAFPGDTLYSAQKGLRVQFLTAATVRDWAGPTVPPGWEGYEIEGGVGLIASVVGLYLSEVLYAEPISDSVGSVSFTENFYAAELEPSLLPSPGDLTFPGPLDVSTYSWGSSVRSYPSGTGGTSFAPLAIALDLTPYLSGDDGWVVLMNKADTSSPPSYAYLGDEVEYRWGGSTSFSDAGTVIYTLRPPRYRLFRSATNIPPRQLVGRDDGLVGVGRLHPRQSSRQSGRLTGYV